MAANAERPLRTHLWYDVMGYGVADAELTNIEASE